MAGRGGQGWLGSAGREEAGEEGDDQPSARAPLAGPGSPPPWTRPDTQGHMSWNHGGIIFMKLNFFSCVYSYLDFLFFEGKYPIQVLCTLFC